MPVPYKIEFVVNQRNVGHASWLKHEPLSLETLSDLLVEMESSLQSQQLSFAWIDDEGSHVFVTNDSDLREAIEAQAAREASTLRFHVTALSAQSPASRLPSSPSPLAVTTTDEPLESVSEETKPLVELSVAEVISLLESLDMPAGCAEIVRDQKISGRSFSIVDSLYDLRDCGLTRHVLDANSANKLLERLPELREKGVPVAFLRNALPEDNTPRSNKRSNSDLNENEDNEDTLSSAKKAKLAKETKEREEAERISSLSSVRRLCVNAKKLNMSPMYLAITTRDFEGVQALLECTFAMVDNESESEEVKAFMRRPLEERIEERNEVERRFRILSSVRELCSDAKGMNVSPFDFAIEAGDFEGVQALLECTFDMVEKESEEVKAFIRLSLKERIAQREEAERRFRILSSVRRWCSETNANASPLYLASKGGDVEGVQALLECTYDVAENESEEVKNFARQSLDERVNRFEEHSTPVHAAAENGHTEIVLLLLAHNANIEERDWNQHTPLHMAAGAGHTETVIFLLSQRANVHAKNEIWSTPLHLASSKGFVELVNLLIAHKADKEALNQEGLTPLDIAKNEEVRAQFKNA